MRTNDRAAPRLFIGNFDFEHGLADPHWAPSEKLKRLNAEMAAVWLSIAAEGDLIWTPLAFDDEFWTEATRAGLPQVIPLQSLAQAPDNIECVPWGWSPEIRRTADQNRWKMDAPATDAVRLANSRRTSANLEQEWNCGLHGARQIESLSDLNAAVESFGSDQRWVIKAEFGMSARERILGRGKPSDTDLSWIQRRLKQHGVVFFEPWVDRINEIGLQFDLPLEGPPHFVGVTPMAVDVRGQYAGSWFAYDLSRFQSEQSLWDQAISVAMRAATRIQSLGYFGPLGIDAMIFRDENGQLQIRPLQDINARWTMGRLSLGWRRLLTPAKEGFWWHGSKEPLPETSQDQRIIRTSPTIAGSTVCKHLTRIFIDPNRSSGSLGM